MIDLGKAIKQFEKETELIQDGIAKIKKEHSIRVMQISREIARGIGLTEEQIKLAALIGLLHDIGKLEVYKELNCFQKQEKLDHGDQGVFLLERENHLRNYIETKKYDEIIKKAIRNHNKIKLEEGLTKEEITFCHIIRDADRIDILYEAVEIFWQEEKEKKEELEKSVVSKEVKQLFYDQKGDRRCNKNEVDRIVNFASYIYFLNFKVSFEMIKEKELINRMIQRFHYQKEETQEEMKRIRKVANQYIEDKINKG